MLTDAQRQFTEDNAKLAEYISWKWHRKLTYIPYDDILSAAYFGLVKAAKYYNPETGNKFATFAGRCIDNEVLMLLRKLKKHRHVGSLEETLGFDKDGNEMLLEEVVGIDDKAFEKVWLKDVTEIILNDLPERERHVIVERYFNEKTQRQVGEEMGLSQSYVCRIAARARKRINKQLGLDEE